MADVEDDRTVSGFQIPRQRALLHSRCRVVSGLSRYSDLPRLLTTICWFRCALCADFTTVMGAGLANPLGAAASAPAAASASASAACLRVNDIGVPLVRFGYECLASGCRSGSSARPHLSSAGQRLCGLGPARKPALPTTAREV